MFFRILLTLSIMIGSIQAKEMFQSVKPEQATLLQEGKIKNFCPKCGMHLVKFYKNDHAIIHKDGTKKQFCSIHCLVEEMHAIDSNNIDKIIEGLNEDMFDVLIFIPGNICSNILYSFKLSK